MQGAGVFFLDNTLLLPPAMGIAQIIISPIHPDFGGREGAFARSEPVFAVYRGLPEVLDPESANGLLYSDLL